MRVVVGGPEEADAAEIGPVYTAAFAAPPYGEGDASALMRRLRAHRARDGFAIAAARDGGRLVGFAYGYTGRAGQYWTDLVAAALDRPLDGHFELVELAVHPDAQGGGIGPALISAILAGRPEPRVLLQTHDGDTVAMRLYRRFGFTRMVVVPGGVVLERALP